MNEEALRSLIRETLARMPAFAEAAAARAGDAEAPRPIDLSHASHYRYTLPKVESACVIEPGVSCNHCGYCESHGH